MNFIGNSQCWFQHLNYYHKGKKKASVKNDYLSIVSFTSHSGLLLGIQKQLDI